MPKPKATPLDHLVSRKKANTQLIWIPLEPDQADELNELKAEFEAAQNMMRVRKDDDRVSAQAELDQLEERYRQQQALVRANSIPLLATSIGHTRYDDMLNAHPPTKAEITEAEKNGVKVVPYSPGTFPPALIEASVAYVTEFDDNNKPVETEPLTPEFVDRIWNGTEDEPPWNTAELMTIFYAAVSANTQRRVVDLGNGSRRTRSF